MAGSSFVPTSIKPSTSASTHQETQNSESVTASAMNDLRQSGINFNLLFIGSVIVENSLTMIDPETRHDVCSACIRIVSSQAGRMPSYEIPIDILNIIGRNQPEIKNCNVDMNVSMNILLIILLDSSGTERKGLIRINVRDISFVSKGSDEDLDKYICFVAKRINPKTKQVERRCYVFYCESDPYNVVNTISLAFKLREEQSGVAPPAHPAQSPTPTRSSDVLDCPTPTVAVSDDPDATPRATSSNMAQFRIPERPTITVSSTTSQKSPTPPPRPSTFGEMYQNPAPSATKPRPNLPPPPPIPGPKGKPHIAIEPSTPVTPDGCIYEELNLPQKMDPNKAEPKDTKGMSFIDKPYTHRRSRSSSPNEPITIPEMFKNAPPVEPVKEKSKNPLNFLRPKVIFKKKESEDEDKVRNTSFEAVESVAGGSRVSFKNQADIIRSSFENETYQEGPNHNDSNDNLSEKPDKKPSFPSNHHRIEEISQFLIDQPWFHGTIQREVAENRLSKDGDFFVRQSSHAPGQMILCGVDGGIVKHIALIDDEGRIRTADSEFNSVTQLIKYHYENGVPITSGSSIVYLRKPIARPEVP